MNEIHKIIEEYARLNGIIFGICDADDLAGLDESITDIPFFRGSFYDRISPRTFLNGAKSVIVLGVKTDMTPIYEGLDQVMAPSMCGVDYHIKLNVIANDLVSKLSEVIHFNYKIQVDSGPLIERAFAIKAGLGFKGKNGCVISPVLGSFFNIALIVTDIYFEKTMHNFILTCNLCNKCVNVCPTQALSCNSYDYKKCISYITQNKGDLTEEEKSWMSASIYGCDICQSVCPHNSDYNAEIQTEQKVEILTKIIEMKTKQFNEIFKSSNFIWRGRNTIKRNCIVLMENLESKL